VEVGLLFEFLPTGRFTTTYGFSLGYGQQVSIDAAATVGVAPFIDFPLSAYASVGLSPQVIFGVKGMNSVNSASEYDLRARLTGRYPISPAGAVYARISPGYSYISYPTPPYFSPIKSAKGVVVDFSIGGEIAVVSKLKLLIELGYQQGYQSVDLYGSEVKLRPRYLHLGAGVALPF
jgi:hypothetical protein